MSGRVFQRIPYAVQVEFRTASSFLVTYSVNLSRGGMFLETDHPADIGSPITLQFTVPGTGPITLNGRVTWRRAIVQEDGPAGLGIEFEYVGEELGAIIDRLVASYKGLRILLVAGRQERGALTRLVRSIVSSAEVIAAADALDAENILSESFDLAIIETGDGDEDALRVVRKAKTSVSPVPVLVLASSPRARARAQSAGADEIVPNPPPFMELQARLVRALGKPSSVR